MNRTVVLTAIASSLLASVAGPAFATWTDDHFPLPAERGFSYLRDDQGEVIRTDPCTPSRWHVMDAKEAARAKKGWVLSHPVSFRAPSSKVVRAVVRGTRIVSRTSGIPIVRGSRPAKDTYIASTGVYEARAKTTKATTTSPYPLIWNDSWSNTYYASDRGESPHVRSGGRYGLQTGPRAQRRVVNAQGLRIALGLLGIDPGEGRLLTRDQQALSATGKRAVRAVGKSPCHTKPLPVTHVTTTDWEWSVDKWFGYLNYTITWKQPVAGGEGLPQFTAVNSETGGQLDAWFASESHDPFSVRMEEPPEDWEVSCRTGTPRVFSVETVGVYGLFLDATRSPLTVYCPKGLRDALTGQAP